jgi:hypothetical protein
VPSWHGPTGPARRRPCPQPTDAAAGRPERETAGPRIALECDERDAQSRLAMNAPTAILRPPSTGDTCSRRIPPISSSAPGPVNRPEIGGSALEALPAAVWWKAGFPCDQTRSAPEITASAWSESSSNVGATEIVADPLPRSSGDSQPP